MDPLTLFIGDSVTDCGRNATSLGNGYVNMIAESGLLPGAVINVGTSGHRLIDLEARWDDDVIAHHPTRISVNIGINDTWRRYDDNDPTSTQDFETRYRRILAHTQSLLSANLVLCEPFLLPVEPVMESWREDLDPKIEVVHRLAKEFSATLVPFDQHLSELAKTVPMAQLAEDGIHPTERGHQEMAKLWLELVLTH